MAYAELIDLGDGTFYNNETGGYYYELEPIEEKPQKTIVKEGCTFNSKNTEYSDNTGNAIIGGTLYGDSNCKPLDEFYSLKDCEFCDNINVQIQHTEIKEVCEGDEKEQKCYNETIYVDGADPKYPITEKDIIDYNATAMILSPRLAESELNKDIPIEVYSKEQVYDDNTGQFIENKTTHYLGSVNLKSVDEKKELTLPFGYNKELHIGNTSTVIELQDADTENLGDAYVIDTTADNYGDIEYLYFYNIIEQYFVFLKFDIQQIPEGATIDSATLKLQSWNFYGVNILLYTTSDFDEDTITGQNEPSVITYISFLSSCDGYNLELCEWDATDAVDEAFQAESTFVALRMITAADSYFVVRSKEYGTTSERPMLNITYSEATPSVYNLTIEDPTTSSPKTVESENKANVTFAFSIDGVNQTDLDMDDVHNVTLNASDGTETIANFAEYQVCTGTLDCSNYLNESTCNNCSQCNWSSTLTEYYGLEFETFSSAGEPGNDWVSSGSSGCAWTRDDDGTPSSNTGPCSGSSNCATNNAGYGGLDNWYVFVETSFGGCDGLNEHAYLTYTGVDMDTYPYMQVYFGYNMYGSDMGSLLVQIDDGGGGWDTLWRVSGNKGTSWFYQNVSLSGYSGTRNIRFDYWRNNSASYYGDIALDVLNISQPQSGSSGCTEVGSCSSCALGECGTNCSLGGCSSGYQKECGLISGTTQYECNWTAPDLGDGNYDIKLNMTYDGVIYNASQTDAIIYGTGEPPSDCWTVIDTKNIIIPSGCTYYTTDAIIG